MMNESVNPIQVIRDLSQKVMKDITRLDALLDAQASREYAPGLDGLYEQMQDNSQALADSSHVISMVLLVKNRINQMVDSLDLFELQATRRNITNELNDYLTHYKSIAYSINEKSRVAREMFAFQRLLYEESKGM